MWCWFCDSPLLLFNFFLFPFHPRLDIVIFLRNGLDGSGVAAASIGQEQNQGFCCKSVGGVHSHGVLDTMSSMRRNSKERRSLSGSNINPDGIRVVSSYSVPEMPFRNGEGIAGSFGHVQMHALQSLALCTKDLPCVCVGLGYVVLTMSYSLYDVASTK